MPISRLDTHGRVVSRDRPRRDPRSTWAWQQVRDLVLDEEAACAICGSEDDPTVDHIVPLARGGSLLSRSNLQRLCRSCNSAKGAA